MRDDCDEKKLDQLEQLQLNVEQSFELWNFFKRNQVISTVSVGLHQSRFENKLVQNKPKILPNHEQNKYLLENDTSE